MSIDRPPRMLIGRNAAHSGSSSTYVTLGRVPDDAAYEGTGTLSFSQPAIARSAAAPAFVTLERQGRRAGLLGAVFTPEPAGNSLIFSVKIGSKQPGPQTPGLAPDEAQAVLDGISAVGRSTLMAELGAGRLDVDWAQAHDVDSSASGFHDLAGQLPALLTLPADASAELVQRAWQRQAESVRLGPYLDHLATLRTQRPDLCAFGQGAADSELAGLEARLGLPLPETLRMTLACLDGGSFVADGGEDTPTGRAACSLLSLAEIEEAYYDLLSINETHAELDGWQDRRAIRPRLRLPDGSDTAWPYLPVARTIGGGEWLVLEALGGPWRSRVMDAFHEVGPRDWTVLYECYADFVQDFVATGGVVRVL